MINEKSVNSITKANSITFANVSMNSLHYIWQTLPGNIAENNSYPNAEFIFLDYKSTDDLEEWVKEKMSRNIFKAVGYLRNILCFVAKFKHLF